MTHRFPLLIVTWMLTSTVLSIITLILVELVDLSIDDQIATSQKAQ